MKINEITQWNIKKEDKFDEIFFYPKGIDTKFYVYIQYVPQLDSWDFNFGDKTDEMDVTDFNKNKTNNLQKMFFINSVIEKEIIPMINRGYIDNLTFTPYNEDGMGVERLKLFKNIFNKLNKNNKYILFKNDKLDRYFILKDPSINEIRKTIHQIIKEEFKSLLK